jgi:hypothetical protein
MSDHSGVMHAQDFGGPTYGAKTRHMIRGADFVPVIDLHFCALLNRTCSIFAVAFKIAKAIFSADHHP